MPGHLFLVNGDLTKIACDAILIPTDDWFVVEPAWTSVVDPRSLRGRTWGTSLVQRLDVDDHGPRTWLGNVGRDESTELTYFAAVAAAYVEAAADDLRAQPPADRPRGWSLPRVALPLLGAGAGGAAFRAGGLVERLIDGLQLLVQQREVDVVLVLHGDKAYAAAQCARRCVVERRSADNVWLFHERANPQLVEVAHALAAHATSERLVLFAGAGVSAGAGAPTWKAMLRAVADGVGLSRDTLDVLASHDVRDQATILEAYFQQSCPGGDDLRHRIAAVLDQSQRYALAHGLLSSLPVRETVTTNFDRLYELAATTADRPLAVLPASPSGPGGRWLLKLHGSVTDPDRMVLTRADYLQMPRQYGALMGIVQALLLMRHMLFVGYSLSDEDFHELLFEVRLARRGGEPGDRPFATVLTLFAEPLAAELWGGDLEIMHMMERPSGTVGDADFADAARQLELFLDLLAFHASTTAPFFLDDAYRDLVEEGDADLRQALLDLRGCLGPGPVSAQVARFLDSFT